MVILSSLHKFLYLGLESPECFFFFLITLPLMPSELYAMCLHDIPQNHFLNVKAKIASYMLNHRQMLTDMY